MIYLGHPTSPRPISDYGFKAGGYEDVMHFCDPQKLIGIDTNDESLLRETFIDIGWIRSEDQSKLRYEKKNKTFSIYKDDKLFALMSIWKQIE